MDRPPASIAVDAEIGRELGLVPRSGRWALPVLAAAFRGTEGSTVEPRVRALMLLRQAAHDRAPFWRRSFESAALALGVPRDVVTVVQGDEWEWAPGLTDRERAAVQWGDRVARRLARRDAGAYTDLCAAFSPDEVVELTLVASLAACFHRFTNAVRLDGTAPEELTPAPGPVAERDLAWWAAHMFDDVAPAGAAGERR